MNNSLLLEVANRFGTPLYVYWEERIAAQYQALAAALSGFKSTICFAVKANSNGSILALLGGLGAGFDIVSGGELARVLRIGCEPRQIVFSGVGKSAQEIRAALEAGIRLFNVESEAELNAIEQIAEGMGKRAPIAFRVNPDVAIDAHPYIATGLRTSKFGIPLEEIARLWERVRSSRAVELVGLDCHIGSQICDVEPLREAYRSVLDMGAELRSRGAPIRILDFGGGHGVSFSGQYQPLNLTHYGEMLTALPGLSDYEVIVEPGKFLVAESGALITTVLYRKQNQDNSFVVVDAGMNDLIRPSLYEAHHHIEVIQRAGNQHAMGMALGAVDVVGPVCESGCFLAKSRMLPPINQGDLLMVCDAGAYGFTMASNYNSRPLPAEVLIERNGTYRLIRKRQALSDLWRDELL